MKHLAVLTIVCGLFLLFGNLSALGIVRDTRLGLAGLRWPSVEGEVLRATRHRAKSNLRRFEYRYALDGATHIGNRAAFVRLPYVDPLYRKYRTGMKAQVYYDPADPARSVVETGASVAAVLVGSIVPVIFFALGGAILYFGVRGRRGGARRR